MEQQYAEFVGVDNLYAAIILSDTASEYVAEIPEYLAPTAEVAGAPEINRVSNSYDNVPGTTYTGEGPTVLTITISGLPADKAAKYLGKKYNAATGRVDDDGQPNPPDVALSFRYNKGANDYRYYQYLKGTFSGGAEEAASKSSSVTIKTYQLTFTAIVTTKQWDIDGELRPRKRIFADTTDPAFDHTTWFDHVQTPDTAVAPPALVLSSSVPADDATGVAVSSNVTLTFNNKILAYIVTLFDDAFAPVAAAITKDATGKILTLNPTANLESATTYTLIATTITDVYGQTLENRVVSFTTA